MKRMECNPAPLVLALVLGPMMERSFRESMMLSGGDLTSYLTRPISAAILAVGLMVLVAPLLAKQWRRIAGSEVKVNKAMELR
jgi:putative tricarboxylic transport membrane protein